MQRAQWRARSLQTLDLEYPPAVTLLAPGAGWLKVECVCVASALAHFSPTTPPRTARTLSQKQVEGVPRSTALCIRHAPLLDCFTRLWGCTKCAGVVAATTSSFVAVTTTTELIGARRTVGIGHLRSGNGWLGST